LFVFLLGAVVGGFASLIAAGPGGQSVEPPATTPITIGAPKVAPPTVVHAQLGPKRTDAELSRALDQSRFDGDWQTVTAVAAVLRERRGATAAAGPPGGNSLILVDHDYRRRVFRLELRARDNAATEIARGDGAPAEKALRLRDLLLAPVLTPRDAIARGDAAVLLADLRVEAGRIALLRASKDPDTVLADLAVEALCRAGDQRALEALLPLLAGDLDPVLRARVARGLVFSRAVAEGGGPANVLAKAAARDRSLGVRTQCLATLASVDIEACPDGLQALITITGDEAEAPVARQACVAALRAHRRIARHLPDQLVVAMERALPKATGALRLELIAALGEAGSADSLQVLESARLSAKTSEEAGVVAKALAALKERTGP
jgi:hypothetical protein